MRRLLTVLAAVLLSSCGGAPLPNSHDSAENLARAVLDAVERRDLDTLNALAVNRAEFTDHVWPELPAARPERNLSVGFVWGDLSQKSNITLKQTLSAHGGKRYELESIRFLGETTAYGNYVVHRESEVTVRDEEGKERQLRIFGSVLEKGGRYKVFSYVIND